MKLTKKTFKPNLEVITHDKPYSFEGFIQTQLECYLVQDIKDLGVSISVKRLILNKDVTLVTYKKVNYLGSTRCLFHIKGQPELYQAFWCNFANLTKY